MSRSLNAIILSCLAALFAAACDGGGGSSSSSSSTTTSTSNAGPCASVSLNAFDTADAGDHIPAPSSPDKRGGFVDDATPYNVLNALWHHRAASERRQIGPPSNAATAQDIGDIAVIQDEGDLITRPNAFDLKGIGLRFAPNGQGGYDVTRIDPTFRSTLGRRLSLGDDDSIEQAVPFGFTLYNTTQTRAFINSDGNITFGAEDRASTARDVSRLLTGPPRVAPFLSDLDPSSGGGIFVQSVADQFTVTWCNVRGFDLPQTATVQTTLLPNGTIEIKYGATMTLNDAVVGLSPGHTGEFRPVDLTASGTIAGGAAAVGERFATNADLDFVNVAKKFYQTHPDSYDQLVIWTDSRLTFDAFAFEATVANEVRGIGQDIYDTSRDFGSSGVLRSYVMMDILSKYPDDPKETFLGENNVLSLLGQECGHRWLAFLRFRMPGGTESDALLGRDLAHWSFFFDSDASVMEGNDIEDLGGGSFRTVAAVQRYSALDQYAMGLRRDTDVGPFFYVESPTGTTRTPESAPRVGISFNGTKRTVLIQDVQSAMGVRQPSVDQAPKLLRQAFVFIVSPGRTASSADVAKIDRFRTGWTTFFGDATEGRGRAETRLRP
jgi:hypothetical protein